MSIETKSTEDLKRIATQVRRDIVRMVHAVNSGHPGGSLGCTELFVALYFKVMNHDPKFNMQGKNEDLFFLSNGHISPVFYSVLARSGYFSVSELATFRKINSRLQGHPATAEHLEGVRFASGSLGQGLSVASGAALALPFLSASKGIINGQISFPAAFAIFFNAISAASLAYPLASPNKGIINCKIILAS